MSHTQQQQLQQDWSDPTTLANAAQYFFDVATAMTNALVTFNYNVTALVGDGTNGPWKGDAAKVAADNFTFFSNAVQKQVDAINGNGDSARAIYNQLWTSGSHLNWAINEIHTIDNYYANEAQQLGASTTTESDGTVLVHVSEIPGLPDLIAKTMAPVMQGLANTYFITHKDKQIPPYNPPVLPQRQPPVPNMPPPPSFNMPSLDFNPPPGGGPNMFGMPNFSGFRLPNINGPDLSGLNSLFNKGLGLPNVLNPSRPPRGP